MEKVRLTIDELRVQSFATSAEPSQPRGTVHAHDATSDAVECPTGYVEWDTCWNSCRGTCDDCTMDCGGTRWYSWDCERTWWASVCA